MADISLYEYLKDIATTLGDGEPKHEFSRYTVRDLLNAYNDAMSIVMAYRPDLFTELRRVKLHAGAIQDLREYCTHVVQVVEQVTPDGGLIKLINSNKSNKAYSGSHSAWGLTDMTSLERADESGSRIKYTIDHVAMDATINTAFVVYPPVPANEEVCVTIKCVRPLKLFTVDDLHCTTMQSAIHNAACKHYILGKMLISERFSAPALNNGKLHLDLFLKILQIENDAETVLDKQQEK